MWTIIISLFLLSSIWFSRHLYMRRVLVVANKRTWRGVYYVVLSLLLIICLSEWAFVFIIGFPATLLIKHFRIMRCLNNDTTPDKSQNYFAKSAVIEASSSRIIKLLIGNVRVFFAMLVLLEFGMFISGYVPGMVNYHDQFRPVDNLVEYDGYYTGKDGVQRVSLDARKYAKNYIKQGILENNIVFKTGLLIEEKHYTPYRVGRDFLEVTQGAITNKFTRFAKELLSKDQVDEAEQAYLNYLSSPINSAGFRSIEFENHQTEKKKVFLIGDSFTWGKGVENVTSSFADELTAMGCVVYNSGIVGVGLSQYAKIGEIFIPKVQPDVVMVNVFLGNDIVKHELKLKPYIPTNYVTNAGNLLSSPHGKFANTAREAYDRMIDLTMTPSKLSFVNWASSQTRITTVLWKLFKEWGIIDKGGSKSSEDYWEFINSTEIGFSVNRKWLDSLQEVCDRNNCELIVSIIPSYDNLDISPKMIADMIGDFPYVHLRTISPEDYAPDQHFNEVGNRKYAKFLYSQFK